jgi:hypothetical protein
VSATLAATRRFTCSGAQAVQLQDGREVALDAAAKVPRIEGMPLAETIEQFDASGRRTPMLGGALVLGVLRRRKRRPPS